MGRIVVGSKLHEDIIVCTLIANLNSSFINLSLKAYFFIVAREFGSETRITSACEEKKNMITGYAVLMQMKSHTKLSLGIFSGHRLGKCKCRELSGQ